MPLQECLATVAQPPLPLHEFLPAHFWSPVEHPPWPLQPFMPLQACFEAAASELAVLSDLLLLQLPASGAPATRAATAAAISAFFSLRPMFPLRSGRIEDEGGGAAEAAPDGSRLRKPGPELD